MRILALIFLFGLALQGGALAADAPYVPPAKLKVGVFSRPPFAMKDDQGKWTGIAVTLWERISQDLNLPYEYVETPLDQVFPELSKGQLDLALGEVGVSADRERMADFTQPFLETNVAVAIPKRLIQTRWGDIWSGLVRNGLFPVLLIMFSTLLIFSIILWVIERHVHQGHFGGHPIRGFGSALWFSAVTMTTVGYGDKTPQTGLGRFLAFIWMFLGILLISAFTGSVASSLTVSNINNDINHIRDLSRYRNGVATGSLADQLLSKTGLNPKKYASTEDGLKALAAGEITAFASDEVTLRYLVQHDNLDTLHISILPRTHLRFAMATRPDYPGLQDMNVPIIELSNSSEWEDGLNYWLGPSQ